FWVPARQVLLRAFRSAEMLASTQAPSLPRKHGHRMDPMDEGPQDVFELLKGLKAWHPERGPTLVWTPSVKCPVIIIYSEKGGVGKTALTNALAAVLGQFGVRVLVIDLPPRATATDELGVIKPEFTVNDLLYADPGVAEQEDPRGLAAQAISPAGPEWPDTVRLLAS